MTTSSRTTQDRHVTAVLQDLWDKGEIYLGDYEGWYCVPDERFLDGERRRGQNMPRLRPAGRVGVRAGLLLPNGQAPGLARRLHRGSP